ncbi:MAG TPA: hypothetical protein VMY42_27960 [Thermoguttaceae bacterium]|nr:hypothetical protein [Thermoguttaceae bacterium]
MVDLSDFVVLTEEEAWTSCRDSFAEACAQRYGRDEMTRDELEQHLLLFIEENRLDGTWPREPYNDFPFPSDWTYIGKALRHEAQRFLREDAVLRVKGLPRRRQRIATTKHLNYARDYQHPSTGQFRRRGKTVLDADDYEAPMAASRRRGTFAAAIEMPTTNQNKAFSTQERPADPGIPFRVPDGKPDTSRKIGKQERAEHKAEVKEQADIRKLATPALCKKCVGAPEPLCDVCKPRQDGKPTQLGLTPPRVCEVLGIAPDDEPASDPRVNLQDHIDDPRDWLLALQLCQRRKPSQKDLCELFGYSLRELRAAIARIKRQLPPT